MAEYVVHGNVGVIYINNPPVNALGRKVVDGIRECLEKSKRDDTIAVVICGRGKFFSAGADINSFNSTKNGRGNLNSIVDALERSEKPVVAAIEGCALGGGLEVALGCHYRIAEAKAVVGFPEVAIGLLPGGEGTQRFPRLVGLDDAMKWISSGKQYSAQEAKRIGAIDLVIEDKSPLLQSVLRFAKNVAGKPLSGRRISSLSVKDSDKADEIAAKHLALINKKARGQHSPVICIQAVKAAALCSFEDGVEEEARLFRMCVTSGQSRALRYSFFGERQVRKWSVPGSKISHLSSKPMGITSAGVVGLGTMGSGIAINFLRAGIPVIVKEQNAKYLSSGMRLVLSEIDKMQKRGTIGQQQSVMMKNTITGTENYGDLRNVDIVIEAVFEEIELKKQVFEALDKVCKPSAILASNTSALNIDKIASFTRRPKKVMGTHFFAPPHLMRLLENVYGRQTSSETIATCMDLGRRMGKVAVLVGNCYGFVANRMFLHYNTECDFMLEEGADPHTIDKAQTDYGFAMGRYLVGDLSGNDVSYRIRRSTGLTKKGPGDSETLRRGVRYCSLSDLLFEKGRYGMKVGKGWYDYRKVGVPEPSAEIEQMIREYRTRNSLVPRRIDTQEVLERSMYPLINEGFKALDEGMASGPTDIDQIWIHGFAWPKHTGGPMFYAHTVGLPKLLQRMSYYYGKYGDKTPQWYPSQMLVRIVEQRGNPPMDQWMQYSDATKILSSRSNL